MGFSWKWKHLPELPARQVGIIFQPHERGSSILLTHGSYSKSPADMADRQSHVDGWNHFLRRLGEVIVEGT